jgi:REP element-mobilizing transposase RayT
MRPTRPPDTQRNNIPHYTPNDAPYFITFNLYGAIPDAKRRLIFESFRGYEEMLHMPDGPHHLRDPRLAQVVFDKLRWLAEEVQVMHAFTVMSNHVHLMVTLKQEQRLSDLLRLVKGATAFECNKLIQRRGKFWQVDRHDRVLRRHECDPALRYIVNNPVKAGIVKHWRDYPWTYLNEKLHFLP